MLSPSRLLPNIALTLASLALTTALAELIVRQVHPPPERVCADRESRFLDRSVNPDLVWEPRPGASVSDGPVFYHINSQGMRGREVAVTKPADVFRILALGDSYSFGYEVNEEASLPHLLAQALNANQGRRYRVEVLNGGVPGYNAYQELAWLRDRGLRYDPDLVLVSFVDNDVWEWLTAGEIFCLRGEIRLPPGFFPNPEVTTLGSPLSAPWSRVWLREQVRLYDLAAERWHQLRESFAGPRPAPSPAALEPTNLDLWDRLADYESPSWRWYRGLLFQMRDLLASRHVPLVVWVAERPEEVWDKRTPDVEGNFERLARESGIPVLLLGPVLRQRDIGPLYRPGGHYSAEGNRLVVQALAQFLTERRLLSGRT